MAEKKKNLVTMVILLVVIAISLAFVVKTLMPKRYPRPKVDWICEQCEYKFIAPSQTESMECPKCNGEVVRIYYYYDNVNGEIFEAYRSKPNPEAQKYEPGKEGEEAPPPMMFEEMTLYKTPGGEWTKKHPMEIKSPKGVTDQEKLEYCPPTSEKRKEKAD